MTHLKLYNYRWLMLSGAVILLDQLSKYWILAYFVPYRSVVITSFFNITLAFNTGAAFSILDQMGGWQHWFFIAITCAVSIGILCWLYTLPASQTWPKIALALILGGATGNMTDRIMHGHVVDFLQFHIQEYYWPIFNVADSAITVGALMLIIELIWPHKKRDVL